MLIDWFTVGAQHFNFVILLYLLKRFLYGPILRAVAKREKKITAKFEEADRRLEESQRAAEEIRRRQDDQEKDRERRMAEIRKEAQQRREELLKKAREEAEGVRQAWREALRRERERFLGEFKRRAGAEVLRISRRAFTDLADGDLDGRIVEVFIGKLDALDERQKKTFHHEETKNVVVTTPAELTAALKRRITAALHRAAGREVEVTYERDPGMSPGIRLNAAGTHLAWNVEDYFDSMEQYLCEVLDVSSGECRVEAAEP